jgi:indole-3-acetate monooxygenase
LLPDAGAAQPWRCQLDLPVQVQVIEELARADASVAWTVMIGSEGPVLFRMLPRSSFDALYAAGPDVIMAASASPTGVATPVTGGYRVTGRWAFASGCQHADWFAGHCIVDDGRDPPVRMMLLSSSDIEIEDTWSVSGLCGTGSHDVVVDGAYVADELSFVAFGSEPSVDVAPLRIPELARAGIQIASMTIGVARGSLDDILALATDKTPTFTAEPLVANPLFQNQQPVAAAAARRAGPPPALHHEGRHVHQGGRRARRPASRPRTLLTLPEQAVDGNGGWRSRSWSWWCGTHLVPVAVGGGCPGLWRWSTVCCRSDPGQGAAITGLRGPVSRRRSHREGSRRLPLRRWHRRCQTR